MSTEPETLTLAQAARRAVDVVDHEAADDALSSFLVWFEDRDEPVTSVEQPDVLFAEAAGSIDPDDPALQMAAAVAGYLSFKRDQVDAPPGRGGRVRRPPARAGRGLAQLAAVARSTISSSSSRQKNAVAYGESAVRERSRSQSTCSRRARAICSAELKSR